MTRSFLVVDIIIRTTSKKHGPPTYPGAKLQSQQSPEHAHIHAGGPPHPCTLSAMHKVHRVFNAHYPLAGSILNAAHYDCTLHILNEELHKSHFLVHSAKFTEWVLRV